MPKAKPKEAPEGDSLTRATMRVTLEQAAALLKITPRRVQQLAAEGWIKKASPRGGYALVAVVHGYIDFLQDEARRTSKSAAGSRVQDRRADEIELRILERSNTLVKDARTEALAIIDIVIGGLRADLMAVPARVTADLEIRRKIEQANDDVLREAAKRAADCAAGHEPGEGPADADQEDDS